MMSHADKYSMAFSRQAYINIKEGILPAGESINCGCLSSGVANKDILGFSYEERKKMQAEARAEIDKNWKSELNAKNKAKANIIE